MAVLLGGIAACMLGLVGLMVWWQAFFAILKGVVPVALVVGGVLAIFVGLDEFRNKLREERERDKEDLLHVREELEKTKAEADKFRDELERMKTGGQGDA